MGGLRIPGERRTPGLPPASWQARQQEPSEPWRRRNLALTSVESGYHECGTTLPAVTREMGRILSEGAAPFCRGVVSSRRCGGVDGCGCAGGLDPAPEAGAPFP